MKDDMPVAASRGGAFRARCPGCGKGRLFEKFLMIRPTCEHCGLDLARYDQGDGPAVFIIMIVGAIVVGLALWVEYAYMPPYWVHALLWTPLVLALSLGMLRPLKSAMIARQYAKKAEPGRFE